MKDNSYNHGASNKGSSNSNKGVKPIGAPVHKPTPDKSTKVFGEGCANGGKKK